MKSACLLLVAILPMIALAVDQTELNAMLETAATNQGSTYLAARNVVVSLGTNVLPQLGHAAINGKLPWQSRLVARICYERIVYHSNIEALTKTNWYAHPKYDPKWEAKIIGPEFMMGKIVIPDLQTAGLWYYYLELKWKQTRETPTHPTWKKTVDYWPGWCFLAVKDGLERVWYIRVCSELMADPKYPVQLFQGLYETLWRDKKGDGVPLLIHFADKSKSLAFGLVSPDQRTRDESERNGFEPLLSFADARHADLLAKFMSERPALTSLTNRLDAVRARKAVDEPEPPFRLGTNLVVVTP